MTTQQTLCLKMYLFALEIKDEEKTFSATLSNVGKH